ncbi:hypothetical protein H0H92_006785 [Tricholoma furcatifolium]|nr:hypothetical protein H0H92_006785 [Tricholoma furcatifolium]
MLSRTSTLSKAEVTYIQAGLVASPSSRADGRALLGFRSVALETGVAPLANGSARLSIGRNPQGGGGGTEVIAATKLEVETIDENSEGRDEGRIVCTVSCSPSAYPHLSTNALDDLQTDLTTLLHSILSHTSLHPRNLGILKAKKSWLLNLDVLILSDAGNILDAIFMASRAALSDTRVPRTRGVEYKARKSADREKGGMEVDQEPQSGFDTRVIPKATDFELPDYWDEGEVLDGRERWPIAVTLNLESNTHFLDATAQEEAAVSLRLALLFSFQEGGAILQGTRMLGPGELNLSRLKELIQVGEGYARDLFVALNAKLKDEDVRRNQKARERFKLHR